MRIIKFLVVVLSIAFIISWKTNNTNCKNSIYILNQVKKKYDFNDNWGTAQLKLHIQEPRVGNPKRHTKLQLKNSTDYFEMERFRTDGIVRRVLTGNGDSKIFLNNESNVSEDVIEQYKLYKERTVNHKNFYKLMYGLPMSITEHIWSQIEPAQKGDFDGKEVYKVAIELKEEMISKHWTLLIGVEDYNLLGIEFNHPDEPNREEEIIKFESEFEVNGIKLPRIRNWYIKGTNEYLGTDIIVEEL